MKKPAGSKITDMKERHQSCILKYKQMRCWEPDREPKLRDVLAVFRTTSSDGVDPEAAATLAGELPIATWAVVWTDCVTESECYRAKPFKIERVPGSSDQWFAYIAYDLELFEGFDCRLHNLDHRQGRGRQVHYTMRSDGSAKPAGQCY
jgi:ribulose-bisphosphate carboxylase large chain